MDEAGGLQPGEEVSPLIGSETAALIRSFPPDVRERLHATPLVLAVADAIVALAGGYRSGMRADALWQRTISHHEEDLKTYAGDPAAMESAIQRLTGQITAFTDTWPGTPQFNSWLIRRLGRKRYDQLMKAFQSDFESVVKTLAEFTQAFLPVALATKDAAEPLTPRQLDEIGLGSGSAFLWAAAAIHDLLQQALESLNPELAAIPSTSLKLLEDDLRNVIQEEFPGLLRESAPYVLRKLEGASFVLEYGSPDAASQAANSLIELTDRLITTQYSSDEVVEWAERELPDRLDELAPWKGNQRRPTRKAQALCYVHASGPVAADSPLHELAAVSLTVVRNQLQTLKHSDEGGDLEIVEVWEAFQALTGALTLVMRLNSSRLFASNAPYIRVADVRSAWPQQLD